MENFSSGESSISGVDRDHVLRQVRCRPLDYKNRRYCIISGISHYLDNQGLLSHDLVQPDS